MSSNSQGKNGIDEPGSLLAFDLTENKTNKETENLLL
jgi:hypothetical protein